LLTRTEDNFPPSAQCPEPLCLAGFQVITAGRFWVFTEAPKRLGYLNRLFWDPREHLELKPLADADARRLAGAAAEHFQIPPDINRSELMARVLRAANGNPGRITAMYRLAADPRYHRGSYVKMRLVQVDLAARFTA
jgi:hypothetical protein